MQLGDPMQHLVQHRLGHVRIQAAQRIEQPPRQHHLPVVGALGRIAVRRDVRAVAVFPAGVLEPGEGELFEVVFSHFTPPGFALNTHNSLILNEKNQTFLASAGLALKHYQGPEGRDSRTAFDLQTSGLRSCRHA